MADFEQSFQHVLAREGGITNDANDPGGLTKFGISSLAFPGIDIASLTIDQARAIYREKYWKFDGVNSQAVADKLLDMCFNLGQGTGIRLCQKALGEIEAGPIVADGIWGPHTEEAVNAANDIVLLSRLRLWAAIRIAHVMAQDPKLEPDAEGLMRRHLDFVN